MERSLGTSTLRDRIDDMAVSSLLAPYDALLLVSFGGPERPEDVLPFLENVTRGRGIPAERLGEVAEHYHRFGGRSPINDQCRAFLAAVGADLASHDLDVPIYWGNRNWDPYLTDTLAQMTEDGVTRAAAFVTSAYSSYSGCRQYRENLFDAVGAVTGAPRIDKLRHYFNHPGFVAAFVDTTSRAWTELAADRRESTTLLFVTHSIPSGMAETAGPDGGAYESQHRSVAELVATRSAERVLGAGASVDWELVYCSRSGPPQMPWLEPDVNDRLQQLAAAGRRSVVVVPIGFVSDHMEVVFDLDTEAAETADRVGIEMRRAATAGTHPAFVAVVRDLLLERAAVERGGAPHRAATGDWGVTWDLCEADCCPNPRGARPALCQRPAS
jgi:ferrochelatase